MVDFIQDIEGYTNGVDFNRFGNYGLLQDGVICKIELIGEIAKRLSPDFWEQCRDTLPLSEAVST